jgi:membrane associated rhomboid family serine protease
VRPAPKLRDFSKYPVVVITGLLAIALTLAWWGQADVSALFESAEIRRGQLWRLITSAFLHADIFHLAFNLYWLWVFGTRIEQAFGHLKTVVLLALFAIGSGSWEFALSTGGIGLSGIGYGLFGMLCILSRRDDRFRDAMDKDTAILFLAWFVVCVAISLGTASFLLLESQDGILVVVLLIGAVTFFPDAQKRFGKTIGVIFALAVPAILMTNNGNSIGNVAHGAGLILGVATGLAASPSRWPKATRTGVATIVLLGLLGATLGRPLLNHSKYAGLEERRWCYEALKANQNEAAVWWCRDAVLYDPSNFTSLINLAIAFRRTGDTARARFLFHEARETNPKRFDSEFRNNK